MTVAGERLLPGPAAPTTAAGRPEVPRPGPSGHRLHRLPADSDVVELLTVGIDVGSATFHTSVSRVVLERRAQALSTRYDVVAREAVLVSPVSFTPYLETDEIDAAAVAASVRRAFADGGVDPAEIDSGVVLLTGSALLRHNARPLADRLADMSGRFVCAAAGHHFEAVLAAHGAGAVERSSQTRHPVVALDIGGATTKFALVSGGAVEATAAIGVGGRLLAWDGDRRLVRVEDAVVPLCASVGVAARPGRLIAPAEVRSICERMALAVAAQLDPRARAELGAAGAGSLLTDPFPTPSRPFEIVASGGVAEFLDGPSAGEAAGHEALGDLGPDLARALHVRLGHAGLGAALRTGRQRIRATVIGASQFSTQVSGSTIAVDPAALPLRHVPAVRPALDLAAPTAPEPGAVASAVAAAVRRRFSQQDTPDTLAVALRWRGEPTHARLRALAEGLLAGQRAAGLARLVVVLDADVAASLGRVMVAELGADAGGVVCLDNLDLSDLDYVDVGRPVHPARVVPVVVKSLLFGTGAAGTPGADAVPTTATSQGEPT
jgi:ethanolamine utilization protein EutA